MWLRAHGLVAYGARIRRPDAPGPYPSTVTSQWSDLSRPPLSADRLQRALAGDRLWHAVMVVASTESTNALAAARARDGVPAGLVILAEEQTAGRGRLDRVWQSPARAGVLMSFVLRPTTSPGTWPHLPLIAGLAALEAVIAVAHVDAALKWPNDVLVGARKLGGILTERVDDAVVVGIGVNVSTRAEELPPEGATSLALAGGVTDREPLVKEILRSFGRRYAEWSDSGGRASAVLPAYRERCETIGRDIRLDLPGGRAAVGTVTNVDDEGRLVVRDAVGGEEHAWPAGDVVHTRAPTEGDRL